MRAYVSHTMQHVVCTQQAIVIGIKLEEEVAGTAMLIHLLCNRVFNASQVARGAMWLIGGGKAVGQRDEWEQGTTTCVSRMYTWSDVC